MFSITIFYANHLSGMQENTIFALFERAIAERREVKT